jgi:hypothetical protein
MIAFFPMVERYRVRTDIASFHAVVSVDERTFAFGSARRIRT